MLVSKSESESESIRKSSRSSSLLYSWNSLGSLRWDLPVLDEDEALCCVFCLGFSGTASDFSVFSVCSFSGCGCCSSPCSDCSCSSFCNLLSMYAKVFLSLFNLAFFCCLGSSRISAWEGCSGGASSIESITSCGKPYLVVVNMYNRFCSLLFVGFYLFQSFFFVGVIYRNLERPAEERLPVLIKQPFFRTPSIALLSCQTLTGSK